MVIKIVSHMPESDVSPQTRMQLSTFPEPVQLFEDKYYIATWHLFEAVQQGAEFVMELNEDIIAMQYIWEGSCNWQTPDEASMQTTRGYYNIMSLKKGQHRLIFNKEKQEMLMITLKQEMADAVFDIYARIHAPGENINTQTSWIGKAVLIPDEVHNLYHKFLSIEAENKNGGILKGAQLLAIIIYSMSSPLCKTDIPDEIIADKKFLSAKEYVDTNLGKKLDLNNISAKLNMPPETLRKGFKRAFGYNLLSYVRAQRLQKAAKLLKTTNLPIQEIAWEVGYESAAGFNRIFSTHYGISPGDYRQKENHLQARFSK